jgi:hypothetical protein
LIQRPYENGDPRGLKLIKAILRPLMLRRTKDTKDKEGRWLFLSFFDLFFFWSKIIYQKFHIWWLVYVISGPYLFFLQLTFKSPSANSQKLSMTFTMPFSEDQKYRFSYEVSLISIFHIFKTKNEISYDDDS